MQEVPALPASRVQFGQKYGVARRLIRAPGRLDGHRYHVGLRYGVRDRRRRHVPVGLEETTGLWHVALYYPDLARPVLGDRRQVLGHEDDLILVDGGHFGVGALIRPCSFERDRLGLLELLLVPCVGELPLQILYLVLQQHVPRQQADHQQDRSTKREASDTEIVPEPRQRRPVPGPAGLRLGLDHLHDPAAELPGWFQFLRRERE